MNNFTEWMKSSAFALALATILGFLLAYALEAGHATYFNIPRSFISTAFNQLWDSLIRFLRFYLSYLMITFIVFQFWKNTSWLIIPRILIIFMVVVIWYCIKVPWDNLIKAKVMWELSFIGLAFVVLALVIFQQELIELMKLNLKNYLPYAQLNKMVLIIVISLLIAYFLGRVDAKTQTTYLVTQITQKDHETPQPFVVLRIYSDKFICALLEEGQVNDRTIKVLDQKYRITGKTYNLFKIIRVTGDEKQIFELNNTGPLSPSN